MLGLKFMVVFDHGLKAAFGYHIAIRIQLRLRLPNIMSVGAQFHPCTIPPVVHGMGR